MSMPRVFPLSTAAGALLAIALLGPPAATQAERPLFDNPIMEHVFGGKLHAVDLNQDGAPDLVGSGTNDSIRAWLNTGLGQLLQLDADEPTFDQSISATEVGDVTGDGVLDVVVVTFFPFAGPQYVTIAVGDGDGGFIAGTPLALPDWPADLELGDLDGDGALDAVISFHTLDEVGLLLNDGAGGLLPPVTLAVGDGPEGLALGDVNADGVLDLVVALADEGAWKLLLGDGVGGFAAPTVLTSGTEASLARLADVNADGQLDLIVARENVNELSVLLAIGPGAFAPAVTYALQNSPFDLSVADLDADGLPEIGVTASASVMVLHGIGGGAFGPYEVVASATSSVGVTFADLGLDGRIDLVRGSHSLIVVQDGDGAGGFVQAPAFGVDVGRDRTAADLDGDGDVDLVVRDEDGSIDTVRTLLNDGAGGFSLAASVEPDASLIGRIELTDLDNDGNLDLLVADPAGSRIAVLSGDGAGGLAAPEYFAAGNSPLSVEPGDLDGDGWTDVVVGTSASFSLRVLLNDTAGGLIQDNWHLLESPVYPRIADFDEDGKLDVAAWGGFFGGMLHIFLGDGTGGLTKAGNWVDFNPDDRKVAVADLDQDGHVDAISAWTPSGLMVRFGDGAGGFDETVTWPVDGGIWDIEPMDMDGDGVLDVIAESGFPNEGIAILHGDGTRSGPAPRRYDADVKAKPTAADFDGDGRTDILLGSFPDTPVLLSQRAPIPWEDLGFALPGTTDTPRLVGSGSLIPDAPLTLTASRVAPDSLAFLVASIALLGVPFKGGVLVPDPGAGGATVSIPTGPDGGFVITDPWPSAAPSGFTAWIQVWTVDPGGPAGFTASNALKGTTP